MSKQKEIQRLYTNIVETLIKSNLEKSHNLIFVFLGIEDLVDEKIFETYIADKETFNENGNESTFDNKWFTSIFTKLNQDKEYHIISYPQFSYLINYITPSFFRDRIIIIRDNLRQLFPLKNYEFLECSNINNEDERPSNLPIYQTEQIKVENRCYYSIKTYDDFMVIDLFTEEIELTYLDSTLNNNIIDVTSDRYSIDILVNNCLRENDFNKQVIVKVYNKQPFSEYILNKLRLINWLLTQFGGKVLLSQEDNVIKDYKVNQITEQLLKQYWGDNAKFRTLQVYRNPNIDKEIIEISQGLIVDTIIKEYDKAKQNKQPKDLFLTAPTGAGKSLLFQLPAFYISQHGDITIIVSPLIALMKDQIKAIINDRKYNKAQFINSELTLSDREKIIEACKNKEVDILYMSPELLLSYDISYFIGERKIGLFVIDEAHLVTTWGRDFRVDYWFLGNYIRKIRKYNNYYFPMIAVTATAIYGGINDMVFDCIDSLEMHNPYIFIGQVKRDNIEFVINNHDNFTKGYEKKKLQQTIDFITKINELGAKTIVYTPYTKQIKLLKQNLDSVGIHVACYYGTLDSNQKEFAYGNFKNNEIKVMVCTKAFGMGVDISDIQVVYHHAPSGLLADYVQEIGRIARKEWIHGFATLDYSQQDLTYSNILYGMSSIRHYQIRGVIKKLYNIYLKNDKRRNLLLSTSDFGHIFNETIDLDQKVLTSLMMIEKDYLAKNRFNVVIARPKTLYAKVYAKVNNIGLSKLYYYFPKTIKEITTINENKIIELDLNKIWIKSYQDKSFPMLKKSFYEGTLLQEKDIELVPQLRISFELMQKYNYTYNVIKMLFFNISNIFEKSEDYFTEQEFDDKLRNFIEDKSKSKKIVQFVLSSYSGQLLDIGVIEHNAFLQSRRGVDGIERYRVYNNRYMENFNLLLKRLSILFKDNVNNIATKFVTKGNTNANNYIRLGQLLEILELGVFEAKGGDNPMVFVRINDPFKIERDAFNLKYRNTLLSQVEEKHNISNQIFQHFFLNKFSNEDRWDFIEDVFLGEDIDSIFIKYKGGDKNDINIIDYLRKNIKKIDIEEQKNISQKTNINIYYADDNSYYYLNSLITIDTEDGTKTMTVSQWLMKDPISFDKERRKCGLKINTDVFDLLISKLRSNHLEYFKTVLGLNMRIKFKGYDSLIKAVIPYKDNPIKFYKWWIVNQDEVIMSTKEKLELFIQVKKENKKVLLKEHRTILEKYNL
ncbi:MAG: DEAD/DEAH box helicase [Bacteroidales bacterium]|jgi:RecQ family ATP-dependent DNA helicase|nr:DEAD/DEAH box helicase [Bacteroidales bacterium]